MIRILPAIVVFALLTNSWMSNFMIILQLPTQTCSVMFSRGFVEFELINVPLKNKPLDFKVTRISVDMLKRDRNYLASLNGTHKSLSMFAMHDVTVRWHTAPTNWKLIRFPGLILLLISVIPAWMLIKRWWQSQRWALQGLCSGCGYDLRESREQCPECGMKISSNEHSNQTQLAATQSD